MTTKPGAFHKAQTALQMVFSGNLRDAIMTANKRLGLKYLDFDKVSGSDLNIPVSVGRGYQVSGAELESVLKKLKITPDDSIIDLGAGKAGSLISMAKFPFRKIIGVELAPDLVSVARKNVARIFRQKRIQIFCCNAAEYKDFDDISHIYMFDPFPSSVMTQVLQNIKTSLQNKPRRLTIIYNKPACEEDILSSGLFRKVDEYPFTNRAPVAIYISNVS